MTTQSARQEKMEKRKKEIKSRMVRSWSMRELFLDRVRFALADNWSQHHQQKGK